MIQKAGWCKTSPEFGDRCECIFRACALEFTFPLSLIGLVKQNFHHNVVSKKIQEITEVIELMGLLRSQNK